MFVGDIAAAKWYEGVLGLKELARWEPEPVMIRQQVAEHTGSSMSCLCPSSYLYEWTKKFGVVLGKKAPPAAKRVKGLSLRNS
jgi:hypothetical protein